MSAITIVGWIMSTIVSLIFVAGAWTQFRFDPATGANITTPQLADWTHVPTAVLLLTAALLHLVPHQAFATFGAIVMTGMIGGMIATLMLQGNHLWWTRALIGILPWLGLYLRSTDFNNLISFWR